MQLQSPSLKSSDRLGDVLCAVLVIRGIFSVSNIRSFRLSYLSEYAINLGNLCMFLRKAKGSMESLRFHRTPRVVAGAVKASSVMFQSSKDILQSVTFGVMEAPSMVFWICHSRAGIRLGVLTDSLSQVLQRSHHHLGSPWDIRLRPHDVVVFKEHQIRVPRSRSSSP